jgi:two-component system LytT family sensor kinase
VRTDRLLKPWMLVSAAWTIPAVFAGLGAIAQARLNGWAPVTPIQFLFQTGDWFLYAFLTPFVFSISRRWPVTRANLARRAAFHACMALLFCVAWATLGKLYQAGLMMTLAPERMHAQVVSAGEHWPMQMFVDWLSWVFTTFPFGVGVYLGMVGIEHATRYFLEVRERELQVARLSDQLSSAKLAALQAQLNPHFLFNGLNTINVLVRDGDADSATRVIGQLSEVLRTTLSRSRASEVTLEDELHLVRQYLAVEQARFSDRMRVTIDVDRSLLSAAVPSFALQHLVENAVRHGIARRLNSGLIVVSGHREANTLELTVTDDGAGIAEGQAMRDGHGIENTRERLNTLYGDRASIDVGPRSSGGTIARLRVPFHELALETRL